MAELVGRCIMAWSYVDWQMAVLLAAMMKAESDASIAIFLTLKNARAQREVLIAAASMTLEGENKEIFDALMIVYGGLQSQRADVAHGVFGLAPSLEDGAAWIETKHLSQNWIERFYRPISLARMGMRDADDEARIRKHSSIFKVNDLERLESDILALWDTAFHFTNSLSNLSTEETKTALARQCTLPQMAQALVQTRTPKSNPSPEPE